MDLLAGKTFKVVGNTHLPQGFYSGIFMYCSIGTIDNSFDHDFDPYAVPKRVKIAEYQKWIPPSNFSYEITVQILSI